MTDAMAAWHEDMRRDRGIRKAWRWAREILYGLPWRYLHGRRQGFPRLGSVRLAVAFTSLAIRLPPPPPSEFWGKSGS